MKKVYIIHGWEGNPENNWAPWLKSELEQRGFTVFTPAMPNPETPVRKVWVDFLEKLEPNPETQTFFVGHSIGCQAIQRYLENLPEGKMIGGAVLVASWIDDPKWENRTEEELKVVEDWYTPAKDYNKIKQHCSKFIAIYSTDDPFVSKQNWTQAEMELGAKLIVLENISHFDDEAGIKQLPEALEAILEITK